MTKEPTMPVDKKPKKTMRVQRVQIRDVMGVEEFDLAPGKVTIIEGPNGRGKTSILEAIQRTLGGGTSLANLQRIPQGDEEVQAEVVLLLEDESGKPYKVKRDARGVVVQEGRKGAGGALSFKEVESPVSWLRRHYDGQGASPTALLTASPKERLTMILESLHLDFDYDRFLAEAGIDASVTLPPVSVKAHPLEIVSLIRDAVFTARTAVNRDAKAKTAAAVQTREKVPEDEAWRTGEEDEEAAGGAEVARLSAEVAEAKTQAEGERRRMLEATDAAQSAACREAESSRKEAVAALQKQLDADIAKLRATFDAAVNGLDEAEGVLVHEASQKALANRAEAESLFSQRMAEVATHEAALNAAKEAMAAAAARRKTETAFLALLKQAEEFEGEAEKLVADAEKLTATLDRIDAYRTRMAQDIPIQGLEIKDDAYVDGVPWPMLNLATRVGIGFDIMTFRIGDIPCVFIDDAEHLDDSNFEVIRKAALDRGVQLIVGRVASGDELNVRTEG